MLASEKTRGENHETRDESIRRRKAAFAENCRQVNEQIARCKELESTFDEPARITGPSMNRTEILDRISRTISREPFTLDEDKETDTWSYQKNNLDTLWFAYQYASMVQLKDMGISIPEEYREKLGFNSDGEKTNAESKNAISYLVTAMNNIKPNDSFDEYAELCEKMAFLKLKMCVNSGKDYSNIANALKGEENSELKARYIYNRCSGNDISTDELISTTFRRHFKKALQEKGGIDKIINIYDENVTCGELLTALGLTDEELQSFYHNRPDLESGQKKLSEIFDPEDQDLYRNDICEFVSKLMYITWMNRGLNKEVKNLSSLEKKYYDQFAENFDSDKRQTDYSSIDDWINEKGEQASTDISKIMMAEKMRKLQASLTSRKMMGVDPGTEIGRFYNNKLREKDTYIASYIKDKKDPKKVIEDIISEKKNEKLARFSVKKLPVNYDTYIDLHTGERAGKTTDEMLDNLAKCLAAANLKKLNRSFSVKDIHNGAEMLKKLLVLDVLKDDPEKLKKSLRGEDTVRELGNDLRHSLFSVKPESEKNYFAAMETLHTNMSGTKWRSSKYKELYNSISAVTDIKMNPNLTPNQRRSAIRNANIRILDAVTKYTDGKEMKRTTNDGQDSFDNALDAMAIIEKYVPGFQIHTVKLLNKINHVRSSNPNGQELISHENFTTKYGAQHSWELLSAKRARMDMKERDRNRNNASFNKSK